MGGIRQKNCRGRRSSDERSANFAREKCNRDSTELVEVRAAENAETDAEKCNDEV